MKLVSLILLCLTSYHLYAQNEGNVWYFGSNAGIDFNGPTPVPLTNGALNTFEGCASIADNSGNLLFYTDGLTVYNANHATMTNGTGLLGNPSSTQSAIIVQDPGASHLYYVFTIDGFGNGLNYSIVNMNLQGGLGEVTTLNTPVVNNTTEKVTAVKHANGTDFWIVTLISTAGVGFHSYLLTPSGLNLTPVVSVMGHPNNVGYLKVNPQGDRIAVANSNNFNGNQVQIYDFDNATGLLSNEMSFAKTAAYGIEFSPNGNLLYVACWAWSDYLFQYNLQAGTGSLADILASEVNLSDPDHQNTSGAIQLGPDFKIYHANDTSDVLGVINDPDVIGVGCNYNMNGFNLGGRYSKYGLPIFFNSVFGDNSQTNLVHCIGDSLTLQDDDFDNYNWALANDPTNVISTDSAITISPTVGVNYILFNGNGDTTFFNITVQTPPVVDLGPDFSICPGSTSHTLTNLNPSAANSTYIWQDGSTNHSLTLNTTGDYWLTEIDSMGCSDSDTVTVTNLTGIEFTAGNPACHDESNGSILVNTTGSSTNITFTIRDSQGNVLNTPGSNSAIDLSAGYYFVDYSDGSCTATDSIVLDNPPPITFDVIITNPLCFGDSTGTAHEINLTGYQGELDSVYYSWVPDPLVINNGLGVDSIWGLQAREYSLEIVDHFGCTGSVDFEIVNPPQLRAIFSEPVLPFCRTSSLQTGAGIVSASADPDAPGTGSTTFLWEHLDNGQTSNVPTFSGIRGPGTVQLTLTDANGCEFTDQIYLDSISPKADFDIESDQFDLPDIYEGTEDVRIRITNLSSGFAREDDPNDDIVFQWNLYTNEYPDGDKNWFFTHSLDDRVDTVYKGEEVYQVCLAIQNFNDCADTACKEVTVHVRPQMQLPNVFTPGAPPNETFFFPNLGINEFECTVFNRYGVVVYEFDDISDQWDGNHYLSGKPCADAVYFYTYKAMSTNGTPFEGEGNVNLLRNQ